MKLLGRLACVAVSTILTGSVQASSIGKEGASFLEIPVGADPAALGSAYTALATNAFAPTWNPAGLGFLTGPEAAFQHLSYLESMNYEYLSGAYPIPSPVGSTTHRAVGFSAQYLGSGDITETEATTGNAIGTFSSHYAAYNLAYGQTFGERLSLGVTGKWINAGIADVSANAFAADIGGMYKVTPKLQAGATVTNMGTPLKFISQGDSLPMSGHLGAAYSVDPKLLVTAEGEYDKTGQGSFHVGTEWRPIEAMSLRVGYKTDTLDGLSAIAGLTAGIGLHMWGQEFAYAWAPYGDLGNAQYFSLLAHFGDREEAKRNLIQYQTIKKHRTVRNTTAAEPEYQQLMQLLSDDNTHVAENSTTSRDSQVHD